MNDNGQDLRPIVIEIVYEGSSGVTTRKISNVCLYPSGLIKCFCHLRNAFRSFKLSKIMELRDDSGALIEDKERFFLDLLRKEEVNNPDPQLIPALRCLKYFVYITRGSLRQKELKAITAFYIHNRAISKSAGTDIVNWLKKLSWGNDLSVFEDIKGMSDELILECFFTAEQITHGSGRKPPNSAHIEAAIAMFLERKRVALAFKQNEETGDVEASIVVLGPNEENPYDRFSFKATKPA